MTAVRYVVIFYIPFVLVLLLHYGTFPLRALSFQESRNFLESVLSAREEMDATAYRRLVRESIPQISPLLRWVFGGSMVLTCASATIIIPKSSSAGRIVNMLSALVCGFFTAKVVIGFWVFGWGEFGVFLILGIGLALAIITIRDAKRFLALKF